MMGDTGVNFGHKVLGCSGEAASSLNKWAETSKQHQCYGYSISEMPQGPQIPTSQMVQKPLTVLFYFPI